MKPFSLLIKPASADCNLRCRYCFYLGKKELYPGVEKHRMSDEVLEKMVSSFLATDQPQHSFGWQGGEPTLMGVEFFKKVTAFQEQYGKSGLSVSNGLQTNTTLIDDEFAEHLEKYNFLCGVSIDGPSAIHDLSRKTIGDTGSHASVMRGLECLRRNNVEYNVLTLVSSANVAQPKEIYHYLCDMGVNFHQYIECVEYDEKGGLMPFAINGQQWGDFLCGIYDEWIKADSHRISVRLFDSIVAMMVDGVANSCSMARNCQQYLVVEYNGDVYPCDFFVERDLKLGNIMENSWEEMWESQAYKDFGARKSSWNKACDQCEYLKYCSGCCPKNRPTRGKDPTQMSMLCEGWKQFYHHSLKGLRGLANEIVAQRDAEKKQARSSVSSVVAGPAPIIGRNDPCPCGSGKKFKKCCGKFG